MILKVSGLSQGTHEMEFSGPVSDIGLSSPFLGDYALKLKLEKTATQLFLKAKLLLSGEFFCDRCGTEFRRSMESDFDMAYVFARQSHFEDEEDLKVLTLESDKIDLTQELQDYSNLTIPMKNLCSDDCKGLCLKCGTNLNLQTCECEHYEINPVWSPLTELKNKFK